MCNLICPACQEKLEKIDVDVVLYGCNNQFCNTSIHYHELVGTKEMWGKAIVGYAALDVALDVLRDFAKGRYAMEPLKNSASYFADRAVKKIEEMLKTGQIK